MNRQPTASGSFYCGCGVSSQRRPSLYSKVASQNAIQTVPSHTVAGPNTMNGQSTQGPVYQDPEYQSMNPRYGKDNEKPVWGLAKPLPRVVRPGMRRNETTDQKSYNTNPRGEAEPAPELGATPGLANSRSNATDRRTAPPPPQHPPTYASAAQEGLPQEYAVYEAQPDGLLRPMENEVEDGSRTTQEENMVQPPREEFLNQWVRVRHLLKEPFAEWLATTIALLIGLCGTLAVSTGGTSAGTILSKNWAWGLGSMVGIYLAGGVSGAHLNPGISIALWVFRGFPGRRCCYYIVAQLLGGLTAAGLAYCIYRDSIVAFAPTVSAGSSGLGFYTEPLSHVSSVTAFFTEFIADAILLCVVFAMGDDSNAPPGAGMHSFVIGLVIYVICIGLGFNTGGCLNPVRDFGPRIVALLAGYGVETFTARSGWWFWGGWVATITGCLVGATLYDTFIFIGGESPINYAPRRRRRAKLKKESKWRKRLGIGKEKLPSLEEGIKKLED
ncbi:Glycerol uptake facilitator protein [Penicillium soppii]|uniref:Glycerol uptake facilitator protein n=1 Tax=Penicillium soppii TaxID=69789 RepID=UPI002548255A|nr:Glycerol uptake facilitator protein [Penicillium soppii]KAJ5871147.1 Glycerol uptake facilitator protein [Penicillium soppii]